MSHVITTSSARAFHTCQRLYKLRYVEGYKAVQRPSYFTYGTAIHEALEHWYHGRNTAADFSGLSEEDQARASALLWAYKAHYAIDLSMVEVVATEQEFRKDELGYTLCGKVDMIVRESTGDVWLMEHKTASALPDEETILMDPQVQNYLLVHESAKGVIYNVLLKPKQRRKKEEGFFDFEARVIEEIREAPEKYFKRIRIERSDFASRRSQENNDDVAFSIAHATEVGHWPKNPYACNRFGSMCEFTEVCSGTQNMEAALLGASQTVAKSATVHTELSKEVQGE